MYFPFEHHRKVIMQVHTILEENMISIVSNKSLTKSCWKIAELGCSSEPNSLMSISNILNIINKTSLKLNNGISPVFQIYLNDLFENDFNTIFKLLPDFYQQKKGENVEECFIGATPGNFYGRLFSNNYIDFFHSSYSLHWLSQAPKGLAKNGEPLNKGNIYISSTSPPSVYESRFAELTSDGMMALTFVGRETTITSSQGAIVMVLNEMVQEGLVEEAKLDLFNLPVYHPTIEEVKQVIEAEASFTLQTLNTFKIGCDANLQDDIVDYVEDSKMRGEFIAKYHRAVYEPLLIAGFGENIMDELFSRFAKLIAQLIEIETLEFTNIVLFMTKNP
ncbi:SAM-dependent carboxyl methyltransferase [Medicago truncatula]|uniref:SAM-dependent carboxyl methyltransferase n=1 Tax=Medicago truncatula TaxID=3880 RepID=G7KXC1_MEDTR|nr:SAM-dependent carboxyl methyltransferase [Medicago truncatula]